MVRVSPRRREADVVAMETHLTAGRHGETEVREASR
jgi:hypothetical protein